MKVALVKSKDYVCDENSAGITAIPKLSCQIFLAASYCRSIGIQADVFNLRRNSSFSCGEYDVVAAWLPLYEGFYDGAGYLEKAKRAGKITVMVLNDPLETLEMEAMARLPYIDYAIRLHEREFTLGFLIKELEKGNRGNFSSNSGLIYRNGGGLCDTGERPPFSDLKHLPSTVDLLKNQRIEEYKEIFIETGRGCPFGCSFCFYSGTRQRKRSFDDILSELNAVGGRAQHIWLHDLNMLADEKWVNDLCDTLIKAGAPAKWGTDARLDQCANLELLKKMKEAGCSLIVFGIESADKEILKKINKRVDFELLDKALSNCRKAGIKSELNIMYGFPWDNNETMKKTEEFIKKYPVTCIMIVRPLRGTSLYDEYQKLGLMKEDMAIDSYIFSKRYPAFPTLYLTKEEVYKWHKRFEILASRYSFKRKVNEAGFINAVVYWVKIKGFKLFNCKKIIEHILINSKNL